MTDQPKPDRDGTPEGYQPPSFIPGQEPDVPAPPTPSTADTMKLDKPEYGQQPYGNPAQSAEQFGQPAPDDNQPADPYGTPYGAAPQQPFSQQPPAQPYGQQPYAQPYAQPYGKPDGQPYAQQPPYGAPAYGQPGSPFNAYGPPSYYGVPPEPKSLSIASLCCGIAVFVGLGFFLLPQFAAVILGHLALKREPAGRGMAVAGLVLGYVGIALTVLVIGLIVLGLALSSSSGGVYYGA
jgi:hypothetical protein